MKPIPYCVPEAMELVLETARIVSDDEFIHRKVLSRVMAELVEETDFGSSPAEFTFRCLMSAYKALGGRDPYETIKARRNKAMLGLVKNFREYLNAAPDRLSASISLVISGCMQNMDILGRADAERQILEQMSVPIARDDREQLVKSLSRAKTALYIVDAAGEIVLDKLLMEEIGKDITVTAVVASRPVLTMATRQDAEVVGLADVAEVVDPGAPMLGLLLERASSSFREAFNTADVVIARGEINYETLAQAEREIYFLLQANCESVVATLDVPAGSGVLARHTAKPPTATFEAVSSRESGPGKRG